VPTQRDSGDIALDPANRFQTIVGWEATAQSGQSDPAFSSVKDELFDRAITELGLNRIRLEFRSGFEDHTDWDALKRAGTIDDATFKCHRYATVNDNADPFTIDPSGFKFAAIDTIIERVVLPLRQRLAAKGEKLFLNANYVAFDKTICRWNHRRPPAFSAISSIELVAGVASEYGMPAAAAARASIRSASWRPAPIAPVGAIAIGRFERLPKISTPVSGACTSTSTRGSSRTRSKAARLPRSVVSSSAPPSKKSNTERGRRACAMRRKSSMFTARSSRVMAGKCTERAPGAHNVVSQKRLSTNPTWP
jgi:hypothetical protein